MQKLTKIVATISDRKCDVEFLQKLYQEGMNVVRLNTAHQSHEDTLRVIENVRKVSDKIALLLDTKGPEIRTTKVEDVIAVNEGDLIKLKGDPDAVSTPGMVCISYAHIVEDVPVGSRILIDDGELELEVVDKNSDHLTCKVCNSGLIEGRKSVNIPSVSIKLPPLSEKDREYVKFAIVNDLDFIAHSFVRNKEDVLAIQEILDEHKSEIKIIAKIENQDGIDNIDEILDYAYGIMIARGDLAIEIPREKIPFAQKQIIKKCAQRRKPVIVATQMLHTMIKNPRPTRAEVSDVANAIFDGTDAIMLSGETAYGNYPVEAVQTMTRIALEVEKEKESFVDYGYTILTDEVSAYLSKAAVKSAIRMNAQAIIADTTSGRTVRNVTGFRGKVPVHAMAYQARTMRELALSYGVCAHQLNPLKKTDDFLNFSVNLLVKANELNEEDKVVVLAGSFGKKKGANFIQILPVKDILNP
ncbi:MAG TPA: pyruvate kinase [Marinilabiliales bacterium]|jgi:pyruvate kinase|nr:MAG: pyruvate kinase [Bacteroidetes bacterium GWA2_40_14]OFX57066.1 MAG: pyruvate kinase [Bacteroidetes bacterium GWC2_40_13]OFX74912.1 MAG: pyruvate kinase [Bacteroidetes bacterium GWD2_40_43]OFX94258.1 MAG: pyruvate kinase [Bacteroidetes bacterium GWE2_40_63]OFY23673.1 MAG: pyruvate kinase [Bacteroidetes bacterium GWF2_40_13]HAM99313.1 pyruvate kinase [Marinilabiliales bacterium]